MFTSKIASLRVVVPVLALLALAGLALLFGSQRTPAPEKAQSPANVTIVPSDPGTSATGDRAEATPSPEVAPGAVADEGLSQKSAGEAAITSSEADSMAAEDASAVEESGGGSAAALQLGLKVIQTGQVGIEVDRGDLDSAFERATSLARSMGGYVVSSRVMDTDDGSATLTLRVPNARFAAALEELADLGKVTMRQISGQDVTDEYVDVRSRLRHSQAVERRLMALLKKATNVEDALYVQDRLDEVQRELEVDKGRLQYLDKLTAMATIELQLRENGAVDKGESWGVGGAFEKAARNFVSTVNSAIVGLGAALPVLLVIGIAAGAVIRRRRRPNDAA